MKNLIGIGLLLVGGFANAGTATGVLIGAAIASSNQQTTGGGTTSYESQPGNVTVVCASLTDDKNGCRLGQIMKPHEKTGWLDNEVEDFVRYMTLPEYGCQKLKELGLICQNFQMVKTTYIFNGEGYIKYSIQEFSPIKVTK